MAERTRYEWKKEFWTGYGKGRDKFTESDILDCDFGDRLDELACSVQELWEDGKWVEDYEWEWVEICLVRDVYETHGDADESGWNHLSRDHFYVNRDAIWESSDAPVAQVPKRFKEEFKRFMKGGK